MYWIGLIFNTLVIFALSYCFWIAGNESETSGGRRLARYFVMLFALSAVNVIVVALPALGFDRPDIWLLYAGAPFLFVFFRIFFIKKYAPILPDHS